MIKNQQNFFPKNTRGLSAIVTILIIILLVLVAATIVWVVYKNLVESRVEKINIGAKCLDIEIEATAVDCSIPPACDVTLKRGAGGDEIAGIKLVFYEGTMGGNVIDSSGDIAVLSTKQMSAVDSGLTTPDKVEVTVYFIDEAGNEQLCQQPTSFPF